MVKLLNKKLWFIARAAIRMSTGIYYGQDMDASKQGVEVDYMEVTTSGGEAAVTALIVGTTESEGSNVIKGGGKNYCMVAFRGRNYDTDDYPNACCDDWWDTSCWDNSEKTCVKAMMEDIEEDMQDIRDSTYSTSIWSGDDGSCRLMNDELASGFLEFNIHGSIQQDIQTCMEQCKTSNGGGSNEEDCDLIYTGHSQGGVYAQQLYIRLNAWAETNGYSPYVMTFGSPPPYSANSDCKRYLPPHDHFMQFVNLGGEYPDITYDMATSVGLNGYGASHPTVGNVVVLSKDSDDSRSVYIQESPATFDYDTLADYQIDYDDDTDYYGFYLHTTDEYKGRIENIVNEILSSGGEGISEHGFTQVGMDCFHGDGTINQCAASESLECSTKDECVSI